MDEVALIVIRLWSIIFLVAGLWALWRTGLPQQCTWKNGPNWSRWWDDLADYFFPPLVFGVGTAFLFALFYKAWQ